MELMIAVDSASYLPIPERAVDKDFLMASREDVFSITGSWYS